MALPDLSRADQGVQVQARERHERLVALQKAFRPKLAEDGDQRAVRG